ncbi:MAG: 2-hydroxy-3-oxopropionate reductase [Candidatus Hydrogenedentota bacterium]
MHIGMIGLGLMGRAMSARLLQAGFRVSGFDIAAEAAEHAARLGVDVASSADAVAAQTRLVILSLMTSQDRRDLLWGSHDLACTLLENQILLDTTTGKPEDLETDSERLRRERNVHLVDVCISGSSQVVAEGRAIALVGDVGPNSQYDNVLRSFCKSVHYMGSPGTGCRAKLIVNLVFGLNRLVLAEALGLARKCGFDLNVILEVLKEGETHSTAMETKGPKMISSQYEPAVARLSQHAKDVKLILELAESCGARTPLSALHESIIDEVVAAGFGDLDNAAIYKAFE